MKVLIADDDALSRHILQDALCSWGYEVMVTCNGDEAWQVLKQDKYPNLVILDWVMPGLEGIEICQRIRQRCKARYIYVIMLTARNSHEDIVRGLEAGADDYMVKPFHHEELKSRLKIGRRVIELEERILQMARTDYLTGLLNRGAFMERLEGEISRSWRDGQNLGIIIIDIDHFKAVNDRYGHQVGDLVLRDFSHCLASMCRSYDFVGRYGGEEFIVSLPGADCQETTQVAERIRQRVAENTTYTAEAGIKVTASFGIAAIMPEQIKNADELIYKADQALYEAKERGRNQVVRCRSCKYGCSRTK
ncbi:GGDEF domain-containing response regulator [Syntrophomonas erecta]